MGRVAQGVGLHALESFGNIGNALQIGGFAIAYEDRKVVYVRRCKGNGFLALSGNGNWPQAKYTPLGIFDGIEKDTEIFCFFLEANFYLDIAAFLEIADKLPQDVNTNAI